MEPVLLATAHPTSTRGQLEAWGYRFAPCSRPGRLTVADRRGAVVGDLTRADAEHVLDRLVAGQHDAHCAVPRARTEEAILAALAAAVPSVDVVGVGR